MYRATYYVTLLIDASVGGDTFQEAVEAAKKKAWSQLVKLKPGAECIDCQIQLSGVTDTTANGEM